eukprot:TRINITY_DN4334_c1_g1_i4.p1 TRINITY_DN4334_c1_g1~~TRINITY_DN4334_c1_g1_i4.p1  ORF type:complete len:178 (+),score=10.33 TRINITY_DN4334_c1_g1_i4:194-727(+)
MLAARCTRPLISDASRRLVFLGPPGVGKGTYARCVSMEAKIPTISTGSLIRDEIRSKTALGQKVEALVSKGGLIGGAEVLGLLGNRLKRHNENGFILDGVPRTLEQAQGLPKVTQVDGVVVMTLDEHSLREKLAGRRVEWLVWHGEWQWPGGSGVIRKRRSRPFDWYRLGCGSGSIG